MKTTVLLAAGLLTLISMVAGAASSEAPPSGYEAGHLYNLGNAYARAAQPGLAVLSYERARLLAPGDADIEANLRQVREAAHVSPETPSRLEIFKLPYPWMVAGLLLAGLLVVGGSGIAGRRGLGASRLWAAGAAIGALMIGVAACNAVLVWPKLRAAVVIAAQAPVRAAPALLGDTLFVLSEAETVDVTAEHEDFVLVHTAQGKAGWIPRASVATIIP
jgi:hypothetical protein